METIKRYGNIIIIICVILEMFIWPSINNFFGCLMTVISWIIFSKIGLNEQIIREHIFAWLVFLSMSLYRILPLMATMLEGHSIGYNFILPIETYCGETLLYIVSALAFYLAISYKKSLLFLKRILCRCGFYDQVNDKLLWYIGILGFCINGYVVSRNIEIGDVIGKTLIGFTFLQFAPLLLFFPVLIGNNSNNRVVVCNPICVCYLILLVVVSFATNRRQAMLEPIGTFGILFLLSYVNCSKEIRHNIMKKYVLYGSVLAIFILPIINDISLAMLYNRAFRDDVSRAELFSKTIDTFLDKEKMETLHLLKEKKEEKGTILSLKNTKKWTEIYVSNFALNRYCNLKVTDNTLYHAQKVGFSNDLMYKDFWTEIVALLPSPILNFLGFHYDKNERYSRGDKLKALSENRHPFCSYLVTSHLADGLLTFGYWYFPIEFFLFFIRFLFLDTFLLRYKGRVYYSVLGLITIFSFLAMFRNAGGCCDSLPYLLRGYWQDIILFIIGLTLLRKVIVRSF